MLLWLLEEESEAPLWSAFAKDFFSILAPGNVLSACCSFLHEDTCVTKVDTAF